MQFTTTAVQFAIHSTSLISLRQRLIQK